MTLSDKLCSRRLLIIGADGADPDVLQRLLDAGQLPNLARLRAVGISGRLSTTLPAVSPVAWTSLLTGCWPARHGILDFVLKAPGAYHPILGLYRTERDASGRARYYSRRTAPTMAELLSAHDRTAYLLHVPGTFPATELRGGMLAGLGTPDLLGTFGVPALYVTNPARPPADVRRRSAVQVLRSQPDGSWRGDILGPAGARLALEIRRSATGVTLRCGVIELDLAAGEWSAWQSLDFPIATGVCRFYFWSDGEALFLYRTPLHSAPAAPSLPFCWPADFAPRLAARLGNFPTASFPMEQAGYQDGLLPAEAFLAGAYQAWEQQARIAETLAAGADWDLLLAHFFTVDSLQHLFWPDVEGVIAAGYRWLDAAIGRLWQQAGPQTALMVVSDHGVAPIDRWVHVNVWLREAGYLVADHAGRIRWEATRAFCLGYGGIYLNLRGRDPRGIVEEERDCAALGAEIADRLLALCDPATGQLVVESVQPSQELFWGPHGRLLPDLCVTLRRGYALSRLDARGQAPAGVPVIEENAGRWRAGHEGPHEPGLVAGVWLAGGPDIPQGQRTDARVVDIAPTALRLLGVEPPADMDGRPLLPA